MRSDTYDNARLSLRPSGPFPKGLPTHAEALRYAPYCCKDPAVASVPMLLKKRRETVPIIG